MTVKNVSDLKIGDRVTFTRAIREKRETATNVTVIWDDGTEQTWVKDDGNPAIEVLDGG